MTSVVRVVVTACMATLLLALLPATAAQGYSNPSPPGNVRLTLSGTTATVTWSPPSSWGTDYNGNPATLRTYNVDLWSYGLMSCSTTSTSCTFSGLTPGREYYATVWVHTSSWGISRADSNRETVCCVVPGSPYSVSAVAGNGVATVSWTPSSSNGGGSVTYTVTSTPGGLTCSTGGTSCTVTGLSNGTGYTFSVTAGNSAGTSSAAKTYSSVTPKGPPPGPGGVSAAPMAGGATVTWTAPSSDGGSPIVQYVAEAAPGGAYCAAPPGATSCDVTGLPAGQIFTFVVYADNAEGRGAPSAPTAPLTTPVPPGSPQQVKADVAKGRGLVTWLPPQQTGGLAITRYVATSTPDGYTCETTELECEIRGLSNGTTYTFEVVAFNEVGAGTASAPSVPARLLAVPTAPRSVRAKASGTRATVRWKPPRSTGGLKVTRYIVTSSGGKTLCRTTKRTCSVSKLARGRSYTFFVRAMTKKGTGTPGQSNAVTLASLSTTPPSAKPNPAKPTQELG